MMTAALIVCIALLAIVTAVAIRQKRRYDRSLRKIRYMFDSIACARSAICSIPSRILTMPSVFL